MTLSGTIKLIAGLSGMAVLVGITLYSVYWYGLPETPVFVVPLLSVAFLGSLGVIFANRNRRSPRRG